jgi:hypothetical protein
MYEKNFEKLATDNPDRAWVYEFLQFLHQTKKWWLFPVVVSLLLLGLLIWMSSTAAAPFIYTLF